MNLIKKQKSLLIFLSVLCICLSNLNLTVAQELDIFDKNNSVSYTDYLLKTHQYSEAIWELKQIINKFDKLDDSTYSKLFFAYRKNGIKNIKLVKTDSSQNNYISLSRHLAIEYSIYCLRNLHYTDLDSILVYNRSLKTSDKSLLSISSLVSQRKDKEADLIIESFQDSCGVQLLNKLSVINKRYKKIHPKKPFLAAAMSTIIPGLGRFYVGEKENAINTLGLVAALSIFSVRGFHFYQAQSIRGFVFGGLGLGFYIGNIYGSYKSAIKYNKAQIEGLSIEIENSLDEYFTQPYK